MTNPLTALVEWRHRRFDAAMLRDQTSAKNVGTASGPDYEQNRKRLQELMEHRCVTLSADQRAVLEQDHLVFHATTVPVFHAALHALAQDPIASDLARAGLYIRGALRSGAPQVSPNLFLEQIHITVTAQQLELPALPDVDTTTLFAAQALLVHDLLPAGQKADFLDAWAAIATQMEQAERSLPSRSLSRP